MGEIHFRRKAIATILCPSCKTANPPGVGICKHCGGKIPLEEISAATPPASAGVTEELEGQILSLLQGNQKIAAIKLYRLRTGKDLKESNDAVEAIARKHGVESPKSGCAGVLALILILIGGAGWLVARLL